MVLKLYVLLGHNTKHTHCKFCDKICHILRVMGPHLSAKHKATDTCRYLDHRADFSQMLQDTLDFYVAVVNICQVFSRA